jgi:hypothetical protein
MAIITSGEHTHPSGSFSFQSTTNWVLVQDVPSGGVEVSSRTHAHIVNITASGGHAHTSDKFAGITANASPSDTNSTSTWPPYKEILFCIKK